MVSYWWMEVCKKGAGGCYVGTVVMGGKRIREGSESRWRKRGKCGLTGMMSVKGCLRGPYGTPDPHIMTFKPQG